MVPVCPRFPYIPSMDNENNAGTPTLEDWQHWTWVMGRAQQMLMEAWADGLKKDQPFQGWPMPGASAFGFGLAGEAGPAPAAAPDAMSLMTAGAEAWAKGLEAWGKLLGDIQKEQEQPRRDRRFASPEWQQNPLFETIRNT
jgi:polyhydroxyalkanoate synthase